MLCTKCGRKIPDGSNFCIYCGADLTQVTSETVTESVENEKIINNSVVEEKNENNNEEVALEAPSNETVETEPVEEAMASDVIENGPSNHSNTERTSEQENGLVLDSVVEDESKETMIDQLPEEVNSINTDVQDDVTSLTEQSNSLETNVQSEPIPETNQNVVGDSTIVPEVDKQVIENPKKKGGNGKLFVIIGAIAALALALGFGAFLLLGGKSLKIEDYAVVKYSDTLNGFSSANIDVDYNKLAKDIGEKNMYDAYKYIISNSRGYEGKIDDNMISLMLATGLNNAAESLVKFESVSPRMNLSNGDEIVVEVVPGVAWSDLLETIDKKEMFKQLGIKFNDSYVVKVSGLEEGTPIDLSVPDIEKYIQYDGVEGDAKISINLPEEGYSINNEFYIKPDNFNNLLVIKDNKQLGYLNPIWTINGVQDENIKEGDSVSLSMVPDDNLMSYLVANKFSSDSKPYEFTIKDLPKYITDNTDLKDDDIKRLILDAQNYIQEHISKSATISDAYKIVLKPTEIINSKTNNGIAYVVSNRNTKYLVSQNDLVRRPNGEVYASSYNVGYLYGDVKEALSQYDTTVVDKSLFPKTSDKPVLGKALVTSDAVRVRMGPGTSYEHLTVNGEKLYYENGKTYDIIGEDKDFSGRVWYQVVYTHGGKTYETWITSEFAKKQ